MEKFPFSGKIYGQSLTGFSLQVLKMHDIEEHIVSRIPASHSKQGCGPFYSYNNCQGLAPYLSPYYYPASLVIALRDTHSALVTIRII